MPKTIDFTSCKHITDRVYNCADGKKIAVEYEGERYILKLPPSGGKIPAETLYNNSIISEHIAAGIFNMAGIKTQKTMLGTYDLDGRTEIVCACKVFTNNNKRLFDFRSVINTLSGSVHSGTETELTDILEAIEKQKFVNPGILREHFWNMFIMDALLGNSDRNNSSWGLLYDKQTKTAEIAPIFNCGSCLFLHAEESVIKIILENEIELNARIYQFPTSAIKTDGERIYYYDFISSMQNEDCSKAVLRIVPKIDINLISAFIDNVPYISDLQRKFYKTYITAKYEKIILPTYKQLI